MWILDQIKKFSFTKFLSGFNLLNGEKLGKLVFYVIICMGCFFLFRWVFKTPPQVSHINGQSVVVQQCSAESINRLVEEAKVSGKNSSLIKIWFVRIF